MEFRKAAVISAVVGLAALAMLTVTLSPGAWAQTPNPATPGNGNPSGVPQTTPAANPNCPMGQERGGMMGGGMMGGGYGYMMGGPQSSLIAVAADKLGITVQDLVTALGGTKSIAQVAQEHNVPASNIVDGFIAQRSEQLAQMVEAGRITQEQADQMLATMRTEVTERVNEVWQPRGNGNGNGTGFVDEDGDGICDNMNNGTGPGTGTRMGPGAGNGRGGMMGGRGRP